MISTNLQFLRKAHHYTQEEVAEQMQVSRQAVVKWENGESLPDIGNCVALAKLYNVTLDNLVGELPVSEAAFIPPKGKHVFGTVTLTERGQIVIPKKAREVFHLNAGDDLIVLGDENQGGIALIKTDLFLQGMQDAMGRIGYQVRAQKQDEK